MCHISQQTFIAFNQNKIIYMTKKKKISPNNVNVKMGLICLQIYRYFWFDKFLVEEREERKDYTNRGEK